MPVPGSIGRCFTTVGLYGFVYFFSFLLCGDNDIMVIMICQRHNNYYYGY
jgi:hypothetical protein